MEIQAILRPAITLQSDAPLYYYSFTDAYIAMAYKSLTKEEQARFDPMITGFNPADMYAADSYQKGTAKHFPAYLLALVNFPFIRNLCLQKLQAKQQAY